MAAEPFLASAPLGTDLAIAGALAAGWLVLASPWVYRNGIGEPDSLAMAVGAYQAIFSGRGLTEPSLYAPAGHPLYYAMLIGLGRWKQWTIDELIAAMNVGSWLATGLIVGVMYVLARQFVERLGAFGVTVALASSPLVLEMGSYGHPVTIALLLFLVATLIEVRGAKGAGDVRASGFGRAVCTFVLLLAAVEIRADVGLLFAALPILVASAAGGSWRATVRAVAVTGLSVLAYLGVARLLAAGGVERVDALSFLWDNYHRTMWLRGTAKWVHVASIGSILAIGFGVACVVVRREWRYLAAGALMIGPTLAFYAGNPFPSRHFLHAVVGGCLLGALLWRRLMVNASRLGWLLVLAVGVVNVFSYVPLGIVANISGRYIEVKGSRRLGESVWELHRRNETFLAWDRERWTALLPTLPDGCLIFGDWLGLANLMATMSRIEGRIAYDGSKLQEQGLIELNAAGRSVFFAGWSPRVQAALARQAVAGCPVVTARVPGDVLQLFPASTRLSLPPARVEWVLF